MLEIIARRVVWCAVFGVAFVINPAYLSGCASEDDDVDTKQVEAELLEDLDAVNGKASWTFDVDGESYELLLALTQKQGEDESASWQRNASRFVQVAHACGTHTFYQSASACFTAYELAIEGTLTLRKLGDQPQTLVEDVPVTGTLGHGTELWLDFGSECHLRIARFQSDADFQLAELSAKDLGADKLDLDFYLAL